MQKDNKSNKCFNLEERTAKFGEDIIEFCKKIPRDEITQRLVPQLVGAGTAIGAYYCEVDCAESNKDFIHKMCIANKEAKEAKYFLRMIAKACPELKKNAKVFWHEGHEINLIVTTIIKRAKETEASKKA